MLESNLFYLKYISSPSILNTLFSRIKIINMLYNILQFDIFKYKIYEFIYKSI